MEEEEGGEEEAKEEWFISPYPLPLPPPKPPNYPKNIYTHSRKGKDGEERAHKFLFHGRRAFPKDLDDLCTDVDKGPKR